MPTESKILQAFFSFMLALGALIIVTIAVHFSGFNSRAMLTCNGIVLICFLLLCAITAIRLVRADAYLAWMPITLFIVSSGLYYGFGPLCYNFGNEGTKIYLSTRTVSATPYDVSLSTILSFSGVFLVSAGIYATLAVNSNALIAAIKGRRSITFSPEFITAAFLIVGLLAKYLIIYPSDFGILDITIPGVLTELNYISALGFGLLAYIATYRGTAVKLSFFVLWGADFLITILSFSKQQIVMSMIFPILGYFLATKNLQRSIILSGLAALVFVVSQPLVSYSRDAAQAASFQGLVGLGYADRVEIVGDYINGQEIVRAVGTHDDAQIWWTRFESSAKQALAMRFHETGLASHSLAQLPILFIPRAIWPNKPIIVGPGVEFYYLVTGRETNHMAITVYADLYWQFGWLGILLFCPVMGAVMAIMTRLTLPEIRSMNFIYFPAVLIAMNYSLIAFNGFLINGILTSGVLFFLYFLLIRLIERVIAPAGHINTMNSRYSTLDQTTR